MEFDLVDRFQQHDNRPLKHFVLQRGHGQR